MDTGFKTENTGFVGSALLPSEHGYKAQWVPNSLNKEFWTEVLIGKTIKDLEWDETKGITALVLDDGQKIFLLKYGEQVTIGIKD